jgi:hypothetical protein
MPYKKEKNDIMNYANENNHDVLLEKERQCKCSMAIKVLGDGCDICNPELALEHARDYIKDLEEEAKDSFGLEQLEHAFLSGLKANNSFYPPSKLWEFYKRDRGLE